MPAIADSGVVLQRVEYSETSQVLVFFTRQHGKVRAIAKGIKRGTKTRFAVGLDLLDVGELVVSARADRSEKLAILTEWKQTRCPTGLRQSLARLYAAQYAAEITGQLTHDWDPHPGLFDVLVLFLEQACHADRPLAFLVDYQRRLLEAVGLWPRLDGCTLCGRSEDLTHFSSFEGGMVCRHCEPAQVEKRSLSRRALERLRNADNATDHEGAFELLNYHLAQLIGRQPLLASKVLSPLKRSRP